MKATSDCTIGRAPRRLGIIGAGWAGLAAAVAATQAGMQVSLWEAARHPGGRARTVTLETGPHASCQLDNGQHILIGAYGRSLRLMQQVGVDPEQMLLRLPLDLRDSQGQGLAFANLPAPWDGLLGVWRASGWTWSQRWALLRHLLRWQMTGFRAPPRQTVAQLCQHLPAALLDGFIEPLCVAALNTPVQQASAQVFLRVLQDSMLGGPGSSNLLIPRTPLGELLAEPAWHWLALQQVRLASGRRVQRLEPLLAADGQRIAGWRVDGRECDAILLATHSAEALRLLSQLAQEQPALAAPLQDWLHTTAQLAHEPIATVYVRLQGHPPDTPLLPRPMLMLHPTAEHPAQFAFDRQALTGDTGLLALVTSTSRGSRQQLEAQCLQQAAQLLNLPADRLTAVGTVVEKRATFACTAGLARPAMQPLPGLGSLLVCGDYIDGPYPGTLEGAVRSGENAVAAWLQRTSFH